MLLYIIVLLDLSLAPTLTSNSSNATAISASWDVDQNAVQYNAALSGPNFINMSQTSGANVTFENLIPATMYTLTVQGVDSLGRNGDPTSVNITTGRTGELPQSCNCTTSLSRMCVLQVFRAT